MPQGRSNESDPPLRYTVPVEIQQKKKGITISFWKNFKHCHGSNYGKFHGRVRRRNFFVFSSPLGLNLANIQIGYNSNRILTSVPTRISLWYCIYVNKVEFITVAERWTQNSPIANMKRPTKAEQVPLKLMLQFQKGRWFGRLLWQRRGWSEFESAPLLNS